MGVLSFDEMVEKIKKGEMTKAEFKQWQQTLPPDKVQLYFRKNSK